MRHPRPEATVGWGHGLPARLTRFFGRGAEIAELQGLAEQVRLLTLVGAPGSGKTRLGIEAGESPLGTRFRDGVRLVELAPIGDPTLVAPADATGCGAATCAALWSASVAGKVTGMAVSAGKLYVGTGDSRLVAYGLP